MSANFNLKKRDNNIYLYLIAISIVLLFSATLYFSLDNEVEFSQDKSVEKIPLYYDLDNPENIYTRDSNNNFIEVEING